MQAGARKLMALVRDPKEDWIDIAHHFITFMNVHEFSAGYCEREIIALIDSFHEHNRIFGSVFFSLGLVNLPTMKDSLTILYFFDGCLIWER